MEPSKGLTSEATVFEIYPPTQPGGAASGSQMASDGRGRIRKLKANVLMVQEGDSGVAHVEVEYHAI